MERTKKIVFVSGIGILTNIILVVFKSIIGLISNSISIILDALNNLTDVLSSIITIIGIKLASKKADKEHPYGHGRVEYFSSIIIGIIVLGAGIASLIESINKIISREVANYTLISMIIILFAVITKYILGMYFKNQGKKLNSDSLVASGVDALSDVFITLSTLIGAVISYIYHISIEGYIGILISIMIIKTSIEILKKTINDMIGIRIDNNLTSKIKDDIKAYDKVLGAYDLILHSYGPNNLIGSINIEVDSHMDAKQIHRLTKDIASKIYLEYGIILTIGIYASNNDNLDMENKIKEILNNYDNIKELHGLFIDDNKKILSFDLIFDFKELHPNDVKNDIIKKIKNLYPDYQVIVILDRDFSN